MNHSRKTLHFHNNQPSEKYGELDFDILIGCYDGAEVCELVGIFILNKLSNIICKNSIGLYRDNSLGVPWKIFEPQIEQIKKESTKIFKDCGLLITATSSIISVDFLDVTLI